MPFGDFSAYGNQLRPGDRQAALKNAMIQTGLGLIGNREGLAGIAPQLQQGFGQFNQGVRESIEARLLQQDAARQGEEDQRRRTTFQQGQEDRERAAGDRKQQEEDLERIKAELFSNDQARKEFIPKFLENQPPEVVNDPAFKGLVSAWIQAAEFGDSELFDKYTKLALERIEELTTTKDKKLRTIPGIPGMLFDEAGDPAVDRRDLIPKDEDDDERDEFAVGGVKYEAALLRNLNSKATGILFGSTGDISEGADPNIAAKLRFPKEVAAATQAFKQQWLQTYPPGGPPLDFVVQKLEESIAAGEIRNADEARTQLLALGAPPDVIAEAIASVQFPGSVEAPPLAPIDLSHIGAGLGGQKIGR